ncbi:hypothetical protein WJX74_001626 [Apatococcus lobatus]|uniref:Uncharacterized protein n=1 Tax=Apatococcus lobatus TaxID=904363 RepID=A0AAW1SFJ2_9CHLO
MLQHRLSVRCPLGLSKDPAELKDTASLHRRVPVPAGMVLPSLGLVVCVDRMARHATVDLQRNRRLVTPGEVGTTLAGWDRHWTGRTGTLPTGRARKFLVDMLALEDTLAAVGL